MSWFKKRFPGRTPASGEVPRNGAELGGQINGTFSMTSEHVNTLAVITNGHRKMSIMDPTPRLDYYSMDESVVKNFIRPSLQELHNERHPSPTFDVDKEKQDEVAPDSKTAHVKFGWIIGVLIRCVLNMLGAMLYLRLSWMAGQCGIGLSTVIILVSAVCTTLTTLSMCAICTNGEIKGGGAYFMLSRALGPEFGGSMGLIFSLANALGAAMHVTGFSETVRDIMKENGAQIVGGTDDIRIISAITICLLFLVVIIGVDFEVKAQIVLLVILSISYVNYIIGTIIPPTPFKQARGMTGYSWTTFSENFVPGFRDESFFTIFAIYFPSATGIMAGANISGDLKDPGGAIPKGTLLAILITTLIYLGGIWLTGSTVIRDASGSMADLAFKNVSGCYTNSTSCRYGLMNYFQTMEMQSGFGPLITAGIFAATLSSALACLVSAPKLFQAVGRDKLFPKIDWFAHGYGRNDEPRRSYILCFFISLAMSCVGDLNTIAPLISNFYLATYALINYACFHGSLAKSPGWRPGFKYFNKWLSLLGAILCIAAMLLMSWMAALLTLFFIIILYIYLAKRKPDVNWGSSNQAHQYKTALQSMLKLLQIEEHVKNYRPQILVLSGNPAGRSQLVDFVRSITKHNSLLLLGHVLPRSNDTRQYEQIKQLRSDVYKFLNKRNVKGFYCPVPSSNLRNGFQSLLQIGGLGKLRPNIVIFGYKDQWLESTVEEVNDYFQLIHECFDAEMGVGILRVFGGLDYRRQMIENQVGDLKCLMHFANAEIDGAFPTVINTELDVVMEETGREKEDESELDDGDCQSIDDSGVVNCQQTTPRGDMKLKRPTITVTTSSSSLELCRTPDSVPTTPSPMALPSGVRTRFTFPSKRRRFSKVQREILSTVNQFQNKIKKPTIDVWWLFDDGGLTLLLPHLLSREKSCYEGAKLRVFVSASDVSKVDEELKNMKALLQKFRIKFSDVTVITDIDQPPSRQSVAEFEKLIEPFRVSQQHGFSGTSSVFITDDELEKVKERTNRHLRTRELLQVHSKDASLIVLTLPIPRKGGVSACLYMAWLDQLTRDLPSVFLVRGNQQSVLTFYF